MVKNSKGGKNSKRIARKHVTSMTQRVIRYVKEEGEMYGIVSKHFGGQCEVVTSDGETRLCIVRGKFKGRQRRDNNISLGTWVMVGVRDWENRGDGKTKCDLLYVYSDIDKDELKQNTSVNFKELEKINTLMTGVVIDDNVVFKHDGKDDYQSFIIDDNISQDETDINNKEILESNVMISKDSSLQSDNVDTNKKNNNSLEEQDYEIDLDEI